MVRAEPAGIYELNGDPWMEDDALLPRPLCSKAGKGAGLQCSR